LSIIEQLVPAAADFEDHSGLIGRCVMVGFALLVVWSLSGIARR
jgi:hypothetical protein